MTHWFRTRSECLCGSCGVTILEGAPCFAVTLPGVKHPKVRCESCAYEPKPAVLPETFVAPVATSHIDEDGILRPGPAPMSPLRAAMAAVVTLSDWKTKASGE